MRTDSFRRRTDLPCPLIGYTEAMDDELRTRLDTIEQKVEAARAAAETARKYLFWTGMVTIAMIVLPAIGLLFAVPSLMSTYSQTYELLQ